MRLHLPLIAVSLALVLSGCKKETSLLSCADELSEGVRPFARERDQRFLGKVQENTARCRGGEQRGRGAASVPWLDWQNYCATGDQRHPSRAGSPEQLPRHRRRAASTSSTSASS